MGRSGPSSDLVMEVAGKAYFVHHRKPLSLRKKARLGVRLVAFPLSIAEAASSGHCTLAIHLNWLHRTHIGYACMSSCSFKPTSTWVTHRIPEHLYIRLLDPHGCSCTTSLSMRR